METDGSNNQISTFYGLNAQRIVFWILGLCNNYGYVVMLTAAHDILHEFGDAKDIAEHSSLNAVRDCNFISTGVILLADILPSMAAKMIFSFLPLWINVRMFLVVLSSIIGFIVVGLAKSTFVAMIGVVFTSFASGLGECSILSYSMLFKDRGIIAGWSSGTGAAGIFGSLTYTSFLSLGISSSHTMFILVIIPTLMAASFWCVLGNPDSGEKTDVQQDGRSNFIRQITLIPSLLRYMIPIFLIYVFEYYINHGLYELIFFPNIILDHGRQYRWYHVCYQVGVFISRSSVQFIRIKPIWILAVLQGLNAVFFTFDAVYRFTPSIAIIIVLIIFEGLLGGGGYVNTYYRISEEVNANNKEFATAITTLADTLGIALAGIIAIPVHNHICRLPL